MNRKKILIYPLILTFFLAISLATDDGDSLDATNGGSDPSSSIDVTKSCLTKYDWCDPSCSNAKAAWKFNNDGSFNYSTTLFGGMSAWGNYSVSSPGKIKINYTRSSEGALPNNQTLTLSSCNRLKVGSTVYKGE
jgi:hypothetical protein